MPTSGYVVDLEKTSRRPAWTAVGQMRGSVALVRRDLWPCGDTVWPGFTGRPGEPLSARDRQRIVVDEIQQSDEASVENPPAVVLKSHNTVVAVLQSHCP